MVQSLGCVNGPRVVVWRQSTIPRLIVRPAPTRAYPKDPRGRTTTRIPVASALTVDLTGRINITDLAASYRLDPVSGRVKHYSTGPTVFAWGGGGASSRRDATIAAVALWFCDDGRLSLALTAAGDERNLAATNSDRPGCASAGIRSTGIPPLGEAQVSSPPPPPPTPPTAPEARSQNNIAHQSDFFAHIRFPGLGGRDPEPMVYMARQGGIG
jgi:hypothetical protein